MNVLGCLDRPTRGRYLLDGLDVSTLNKNMLAEIRKLKRESGPDLLIFGSGTVVSQLTQAGLIDEYQIVVNPVILGAGKSMFAGVTEKPVMKQTKTRAFGNGNVFLCYQKM